MARPPLPAWQTMVAAQAASPHGPSFLFGTLETIGP